MPQFVMNGKESPAFESLDAFTQGYIEALFFTEEERLCEESARDMPTVAINTATMESSFIGGDSPGFEDLAPETLAEIIADCVAFQRDNAELLEAAREYSTRDDEFTREDEYDDDRAGNDFWYTRNGHGVGFWDRGLGAIGDKLTAACGHGTEYAAKDAYIGDDGRVYLS